jgi:hypothetical protein
MYDNNVGLLHIYIDAEIEKSSDMKNDIERNWRLILHDDSHHEIEQVVDLLIKV